MRPWLRERAGIRGWLSETAGGLPATYWYLWTGTLINRAGGFVVVYLTIYLTTVQHFSSTEAGLVLGLWAAGGAVGTMIGGVAADRIGRRPSLLAAHLGACALLVSLAFAQGLAAIAALTFLFGLVAESARPAFQALMIDVVPERDRLRAFTLTYWAVNVGFAVAATVAGLVAKADPKLIFMVDAATTLAPFLLILLKVREPQRVRPVVAADTPVGPKPGLGTVLRDRIFIGFVLLNVLISFVFMQHLSTLPIAMTRDGIPPQQYGLVIALNGVLIVAGQLFIPRLIKQYDRSRVLAAAALIIGLGFGLTAFADSAAFYAVTVLIWTVGEMLNSPSNSTLIAALSPAAMRGRYQGMMSLSWSVAGFAAPVLGGWVQQHLGDEVLWLGCALIAAVAAGAQLWAGPARERRAAALRAM
ncbi:MDR family MFS transporter [Catellatospora tritici]|uniref:MDR family MFS transporter n=1 Tax=Catellatospora tritici TaxID=2851566 RepID=UPI001C2D6DDB|nr:MFS transporter [Catellatospora tritici]MBV1849937.1 MFS transporter [Catellatospora tritici]